MDIQGQYIDPEKEKKKVRPLSNVNNHICGDMVFFNHILSYHVNSST